MGGTFDQRSPIMVSNPPLFPLPSSSPNAAFTFAPSPLPATLHFPAQATVQYRRAVPSKRARPLTDVDGENSSSGKKKRRLRLLLITSRLSSPYSAPATNIANRGNSKIAIWAKQKATGGNLLRKAAILNRIRRLAIDEGTEQVLGQAKTQRELELARLAFVYGSHDTHTRPVLGASPRFSPTAAVRIGDHFSLSGTSNDGSDAASSSSDPQDTQAAEPWSSSSPNAAFCYPLPRSQVQHKDQLPPSPLGLSNYDAFDLEEEVNDPYAHLDDEYDDPAYDDPTGNYGDDHETSASFATAFSTADSGASALEAVKTPPQTSYYDFNVLETGGSMDDLDGIDSAWPGIAASPQGAQSKKLPSFQVPSSSGERDWGGKPSL